MSNALSPIETHQAFVDAARPLLATLYPERYEAVLSRLVSRLSDWQQRLAEPEAWGQARLQTEVTEKDVMLITYGDTLINDGEPTLKTLERFLKEYVGDLIPNVHLLPCFSYSSDDGFSVIDYLQINPVLGGWKEVHELASHHGLMLDAVVNHISRWSRWFEGYLAGEAPYSRYFIEADPGADYSQVTRPRTLPLLHQVETSKGPRHVWTTFSADQVDLNFAEPDLLLEVMDVLLSYVDHGSRFIRLDAVGFVWKQLGTSCMHLPGTHAIVKLIRLVLNTIAPGAKIIPETNVPHKENISYFGEGDDEADLVYQFTLPPLVLHSFVTGRSTALHHWLESLEPCPGSSMFFNFLASHDGIGMRATEGLLDDEDRRRLMQQCLDNGGRIGYKSNPDGTQAPYELNISYIDALSPPTAKVPDRINRMLAAHFILLSLQGLPAIYIHSLLGSGSDFHGMHASGVNRRVNRGKVDWRDVKRVLDDEETENAQQFRRLLGLISIRRREAAFHPSAAQRVLNLDERLFALERECKVTGSRLWCLANLSEEEVSIELPEMAEELIQARNLSEITLGPNQYSWLRWSEPVTAE
ncbi:alpha-amylase family glycosyl hydrolase [Pokkaliibacter sp. CJK22405]|uniref:alpha-amylase family glycosyl hydrolase n=1 Tax=Pokkaliibacter sp. CJK22405 TaxID=3384615 RepID=UPI003984FE01